MKFILLIASAIILLSLTSCTTTPAPIRYEEVLLPLYDSAGEEAVKVREKNLADMQKDGKVIAVRLSKEQVVPFREVWVEKGAEIGKAVVVTYLESLLQRQRVFNSK